MDLVTLFGMVDGLARIAAVGLVLLSIGAIVVFFRVFASDFNGPD